jgi:hypothetical protein
MPHGGKRRGAGRPFGTGMYGGEPTKVVRVPLSTYAQVQAILEAATQKARNALPPADTSGNAVPSRETTSADITTP